MTVELLAYYLPQFHPIPENDLWWSPGFTEWTKVAGARPLFRGHHQPHLPADLGFYDLRNPETRAAQAALAASYGLTGFIYWHYWSAGTELLERPFNEALTSGEPDFPFALAWANHSWERRSGPKATDLTLLRAQTYPGPDDDRAHFESLRPAFEDARYVRIGGKPVFFVFDPTDLPDPAGFVERWQSMASDLGGLYLVAMAVRSGQRSFEADGFDAATFGRLPIDETALGPKIRRRLRSTGLARGPERHHYRPGFPGTPPPGLHHRVFPVVTTNWDNTPRRQEHGVVVEGGTPALLETQLHGAFSQALAAPPDEQLVILRSWNEWGEGNYLEPDQEFGLGWLQAVAAGLTRSLTTLQSSQGDR